MECCLLLRGEMLMSDFDGSCDSLDFSCASNQRPYKKLGNMISCNILINSQILGTENKHIQSDSTCPRSIISGVNITLTLACASKDNLLKALYSLKQVETSGDTTDHFCIEELETGYFFPFKKKQATPETVVVKLTKVGGEVATLVLDTDYRLSKSGVEIIADIDIEDATEIEISYSFQTAGFNVIDLGSKKIGYKSLYFKGTNYAEDPTKLFVADIPKVLLRPMSGFDLISSGEFFTIVLEGVVEKVNGSWFKITKQE